MKSNPILETLVSPAQARVLAVLSRAGQPLTGRTIARLTEDVSQSTVSRLLLDLQHAGLVLKVPGGYVMNREHLAYVALESLLDAPQELQRRVAGAVGGWATPPVSVVLFGSTARRSAGRTSDVDVLILRPPDIDATDEAWALNVSLLAEQVGRWWGAPCEVLEYTPGELVELHETSDPLIESLLRDGVTVSGLDLPSVLAAASR